MVIFILNLTKAVFHLDVLKFLVSMDIQKLESIQDLDQQAIKDFLSGTITRDALDRINRENKAFLIESIALYGFPFKDIASERAYKGAFLVVQHSCDLGLMDATIEAFLGASEAQIDRKDLGYLIDRARILRNLPQVYGTQYQKLSDGTINFLPIEDREGVNGRRAELRMGTIEEYEKAARV